MNGCLLKTLAIFAILLALFVSVPHLKKFASESVQEKIDNWTTQITILKKITYHLYNERKNDDNKNKKTGK